jgi:hypothetical protein
MKPECTVDELELIALLEGELTENRAAQLREHLSGCAACGTRLQSLQALVGRLRAPVPEANDPGFVDAVERRLPAASSLRSRRLPAPLVFGLPALVAAAAAVVMLVMRPAEFTPRGTPAPWHEQVFTSLEIVSARGLARPLRPGDRLMAGDGIAVSARNGHARQPVYLMVFAVDARKEVHWIVPAWSDPATSPRSVALPPGGELPEPTGRTPDAPAAGKLQVLTLLTRAPLDVRAVESTLRAGRPVASGEDRHLRTIEAQMAGGD